MVMGRGGAATWIFRQDGVAATPRPSTRIFREDGVAAAPRPRRGYSVEAGFARGDDPEAKRTSAPRDPPREPAEDAREDVAVSEARGSPEQERRGEVEDDGDDELRERRGPQKRGRPVEPRRDVAARAVARAERGALDLRASTTGPSAAGTSAVFRRVARRFKYKRASPRCHSATLDRQDARERRREPRQNRVQRPRKLRVPAERVRESRSRSSRSSEGDSCSPRLQESARRDGEMETPPRYDGGTCSTSGGRSQGGASSGGSSALPNASAPNAIAAPKYLRKRSSDEAFGATTR